MLIFIALYGIAAWLQYLGVYHIPWWAWLCPIWIPIMRDTTTSIVGLSKRYPFLSLGLMVAWGWCVIRIFGSLGVL